MSAAPVDDVEWPEVVAPGTKPDPEEARRRRILAQVRTGDWLDAQDFAPLRWAVPGIVPEGFGLIVGPPKIGKSWLVLGVALSAAAGGRAFARIDVGPARPVLYLALEDGDRRLQHRCRTLMVDQPIPPMLHHATRLPEGSVVDTIRTWLDVHAASSPMVILDTLGRVMPPAMAGESAYQRDYRIGATLKALTDEHPGATLLVVHHTRKAAGADWMDATSGTQGLNGSADFTIALERARNETSAVLRVTGRDVREDEIALTSTAGSWALAGDTIAAASAAVREAKVTAGLGDRSAEIVAFAVRSPKGVTAAEVEAALGVKDARRYLARLVENGRLTRPPRQRGVYTAVPSVPSVPFEWDEHPDGTDGTDGTPDSDRPAGPPPANGTPGTHHHCTECGYPLADALINAGETTHPACGD